MCMTEPRIAEMSDAAFDAMIEAHIDRMAEGTPELPGDVFLDLLFERIAAHADVSVTLASAAALRRESAR